MSIEVNNESGAVVDEAEFAALARHVLDAMHVHPQTDLSILLVGVDVASHIPLCSEDCGPAVAGA